MTKKWDAFISHASEDKDAFVRPLAGALAQLGAKVWFDEFSLKVGDSLSGSIDRGIADSAFGIVVLSPAFLRKDWTVYELRGLVARDVEEDRVILPVWHEVERKDIMQFSPSLADKVAILTRGMTAEDIAIMLLREIRPDIYSMHPRAELERLASGEALEELQDELEAARERLAEIEEELEEYRCPYCQARVAERFSCPLDDEQKDWGTGETFECGLRLLEGYTERPCPADPEFPKFEDYKLHYRETEEGWYCSAIGNTPMAHKLSIWAGYGATQELAGENVKANYLRLAGSPR